MASHQTEAGPDPFIVDEDAQEAPTFTDTSKLQDAEGLSSSHHDSYPSQADGDTSSHHKDASPPPEGPNPHQAGVGQDNPSSDPSTTPTASKHSERGSQTTDLQQSAFVEQDAAPVLGPDPIKIVDAQKTSDGVGQSPYIAYLIECGTMSAKRRYSEFSSLRDALVTLHPTLIIPPIPSKHSLTDYAARQSKAKEDATIIARRKRMLQVFLNRIKQHEKLSRSVVYRRFLDGRWSWHEITSSPPLSTLPRSNLRAPAADPSSPLASPAYLALPLPPNSATSPLKHPNTRFLDSEAFTERFRNHVQGSLEKVNRRIVKRWSEASGDYAELGAVLNGFSLSESGSLASAIERTGQAADSTFMAIGHLLQDWEMQFTEPLHEYAQFATILQKLLKWRHLKHLQFEMAQDALEAKKLQLEELERVEAEASRLNAALESGGRGLVNKSGSANQSREGVWDSVNARSSTMRKSVYGSAAEPDVPSSQRQDTSSSASPRSTAQTLADDEDWGEPNPTNSAHSSQQPNTQHNESNGADGTSGTQRHGRTAAARIGAYGSTRGGGSGGGGILGALSHTFHSVMDVDPEATRRNTISRLKDNCAQLEEALELTERDLKFATSTIQADLDRFQRQKIKDIREMVLAFAYFHRDYCRASMESWKEAKDEIDAITDHTPLPQSSLSPPHRTSVKASSSDSKAQLT